MVQEHRTEHLSQWAAIESIADKIGCIHRPCIFTYVKIYQGWVYVVFVIAVFCQPHRGLAAEQLLHTDFVLDALEHDLYDNLKSIV